MDINNSADVINRIKLRSIIIAIAVYLAVAIFTTGIAIIPIVVLWAVGYLISKREIDDAMQSATSFKRVYPFRYFGTSFGNFTHVFHHASNLENRVISTIEGTLRTKTPVSGLSQVVITDIDKNLCHNESQCFRIASSGRTRRGTVVTLIIRFASFGGMQSIQWWALAGGYIDRDKKFNFVVYTPILIWFWIIPYLKKDYDVVSTLRTVYGSTYNDFEVETHIRSLHNVVFNSLIEELEANGVDTSDLQVQRMQVMNLNVSGGHVNIGNMVQGSMDKIKKALAGEVRK